MVKHQQKTQLFQFLDLLPRRWGFALYHKLQQLADKKTLPQKIKPAERTFQTARDLCEKHQVPLEGGTLIEIGSGWLPIMPYFFLTEGKVSEVHSYDLNEHYQKKAVAALNDFFTTRFPNQFPKVHTKHYPLASGLVYHPKTNLVAAALPEASLVFSRFVLEHVRPEDIQAMHLKFAKELPPGSHLLHFISPSDHRAHSDQTLSLQDFLQYSEAEWNGIQTKFDYHNRLRLPQYLSIFEACGFEIVFVSHDNPEPGSKRHQQFSALDIHPDFQHFTEKELTAGSIVVLLKT